MSAPDPEPSFTPIAEVGEFGLIARLQEALKSAPTDGVVVGIGDDAAVVEPTPGLRTVVTTDALVEGVHFDRTFTPMRYLGWKALAVNVSDIAAMNARPRFATVALGVPGNVGVEHLESLYTGLAEAAARFGVAVVGGDVTAAQRLVISVTVLGEAAPEAVVTRAGARPGDLLCVTGDVGSAAAGLRVLLAGKQAMSSGDGAPASPPQMDLGEFAYVVQRQLYPQPRLDRVAQFAEAGVTPRALIDVSDGLASEVHHLCAAADVGCTLEAGLLPLHVQTFRAAEKLNEDPARWALYGGEDYELLFALSPADAEKLPEDAFAVVGTFTEPEDGVHLRLPDGGTEPLAAGGFDHFG